MRLRRLDIEVFDYFVQLRVPREVFAPLRNQADVLSWHLWRFLRTNKVTAPVSRTRLLAQPYDVRSVTDEFSFIKINPDPPFDFEKGPLEKANLDAMASLVVGASQSSFDADWSWTDKALSDFEAADFEARCVRAVRRPRGTDVELRLEERVSFRAASVDFVAFRDGKEKHRETISQISILPILWSGCLNKIELDGTRISIAGKVPTAIPQDMLGSAPHGAKRTELEWYKWSRTFSEMKLD